MKLTVGSLFAGIGGIELGLEMTGGFETKWQVEINEYARQVLGKHWPNARRYCDICDFYPGSVADVDVITAGFPCQDLSYAGRGDGLDGERSGLFFEAIRVIRGMEPRYVLLENVTALLNRGLDVVLGELASLGYDAEWHCVQAASFGAPHIRDRIFVLAHAKQVGRRAGSGEQVDEECEGERWRKPSGSSQALADTSIEGLPIPEQKELRGEGWRYERGAVTEHGWWASEPDVGRVAYGVSFELDCLRRRVKDGFKSDDSEEDATRVWTHRGYRLLRSVWEQRQLAATSPRLYVERVLSSVPEVPHGGPYGGWYLGSRIEKNKGLCDLWEDFYSKPFQEAQDVQQRLLEQIRKEKRPQALASRVDRLKCLGNAVVPACARWFGERILALEEESNA